MTALFQAIRPRRHARNDAGRHEGDSNVCVLECANIVGAISHHDGVGFCIERHYYLLLLLRRHPCEDGRNLHDSSHLLLPVTRRFMRISGFRVLQCLGFRVLPNLYSLGSPYEIDVHKRSRSKPLQVYLLVDTRTHSNNINNIRNNKRIAIGTISNNHHHSVRNNTE